MSDYLSTWVRGPYFVTAFYLTTSAELFCLQNSLIPVATYMLTGLKELTEADITAGLITGEFTIHENK